MSNKLRSHGKGVVVWVLLAMLVLGLGGFGVSNFSGRVQSIGSVGKTEISINDYARALRSGMSAAQAQLGRPLTFAEAKALGLDRQVQAQVFAEAAVSEQARRLGISVGNAEVSRQVHAIRSFQGVDGKFDREVYRMALRQQGYTETQFETRLRSDVARSILQGAVAGGVKAPEALAAAYTKYVTEKRDIAYAEITEADLTAALPEPTEDELKAWHTDHAAEFTKPETREISYVWLTPEMLKDKVQLDDATLRAAYEERKSEFVQPEKRLVDKLVFPTGDEAEAAKKKLDAGTASFAEIAKERGLTLADTDLGEVSKEELGTAGDAVFALTAPGTVGPIDSDLGPALYQMNGILPAEETTFEQAKPDLETEAVMDRARRMVSDMTSDLEDRLASGATLEDMAKETDMQAGHISMAPDTTDGIAAYESFRTAAAKVTEQDFPELGMLEDGGVFALRLDGVTPAALIPFEQTRDKVLASWKAAQLKKLKTDRAEEIVAAVSAGASLADQGLLVSNATGLERSGFIEGAPTTLLATAFDTTPGTAAVVTQDDTVFVVVPLKVTEADPQAADTKQVHDVLSTRLEQSMAGDLADLYARASETEAGLTIDSTAINAVQAQMQ